MVREAKPENGRLAIFLGLMTLSVGIFFRPMGFVVASSVAVDQYSHILMVVPIGLTLLYMERKRVLSRAAYFLPGTLLYLAAVGVFAYLTRSAAVRDHSIYISISVLMFAVSCISAFLLCYGTAAFKAASFPLLFLLLMTPLPDGALNRTITFLQEGSAQITGWFFALAGVHFFREGVVILLPEVTIEVAKECSGIRSSLILVISGLVLAHLFLRSPWSKLALAIAIIPMTIIKNGIRIFTLTMLGTRVDGSFLTGRLHHQGGIVFFAIAFAAIWGMVWILQRLEGRMRPADSDDARLAPARPV